MKLKEIKPKMAIHCTEKEQIEYLVQNGIAEISYLRRKTPVWFEVGEKGTIVGWMPEHSNLSEITGEAYYKNTGCECVEFSDLLEPEMTAEEVLSIFAEINDMCNIECDNCPLSAKNRGTEDNLCNADAFEGNVQKVIEGCQQWKSNREKKEKEVEWFWQGRIFKVHEDGCYYQIKDGTGFCDTGCEYRESAEEYMADELKEYCKTHEGNYIAMVEHVCRVKGGKLDFTGGTT